MALKTTECRRCGKEIRVQIYGPHKDRERKLANGHWLCDDCKEIEREEKMVADGTKAAAEAKSYGLPELKGTPKQVAWAEKIRMGKLRWIDLEEEEREFLTASEKDLLNSFMAIDSAKEIIDMRDWSDDLIVRTLKDRVAAERAGEKETEREEEKEPNATTPTNDLFSRDFEINKAIGTSVPECIERVSWEMTIPGLHIFTSLKGDISSIYVHGEGIDARWELKVSGGEIDIISLHEGKNVLSIERLPERIRYTTKEITTKDLMKVMRKVKDIRLHWEVNRALGELCLSRNFAKRPSITVDDLAHIRRNMRMDSYGHYDMDEGDTFPSHRIELAAQRLIDGTCTKCFGMVGEHVTSCMKEGADVETAMIEFAKIILA